MKKYKRHVQESSPALMLSVIVTSAAAFAREDYTQYKGEVPAQGLGSLVKQTTQDGIKAGGH
jgi:hypothetical protein